jgi:plasmid stabilization system protein ParE
VRKARLSRSAAHYLRREIAYVAERNPAAARKVTRRLDTVRSLLADRPTVGEASEVAGLRRFVDARYGYVFACRLSRGQVEIAAVWHGRQRPALDLDPEGPEEASTHSAPKPW